MWKVLSTAALLSAMLVGAFAPAAEARSKPGAHFGGGGKIVRIGSPFVIKKHVFVKPVYFKTHHAYRPVLLVGSASYAGGCGYAYHQWQATGLGYWKARYFNCAGHD